MYTLKEAAEAVGLGKPAILKAIQRGTISAKKNELGQWEIDPAELHRVYKPVSVSSSIDRTSERQETDKEIIEVRVKLEALREVNAQLESERNDLRRRLDDEATERRKLTALLIHRSEPKPEQPAETPAKEEPPAPPPVFLGANVRLWVFLALVATAVVAWFWWTGHPSPFPLGP